LSAWRGCDDAKNCFRARATNAFSTLSAETRWCARKAAQSSTVNRSRKTSGELAQDREPNSRRPDKVKEKHNIIGDVRAKDYFSGSSW